MGETTAGVKYDNDKDRWDLLPIECVEPIVKVLTFGAKKYTDNNWKKIPNKRDRYYAALMRHLVAYRKGEIVDKESGLPHLAHAGCCLIFMIWEEQNVDKTVVERQQSEIPGQGYSYQSGS